MCIVLNLLYDNSTGQIGPRLAITGSITIPRYSLLVLR